MALSANVKTAVDGMDPIDRGLLVMYAFGVDDISLIAKLGARAIEARAAYLTSPTNEQMAIALLQDFRDYARNTYAEREAKSAARLAQIAARQAALDEVVFGDIGSLPEPEGV